MQFINPNILGSYAFFAEHYKVPIEKQDETVCWN
jgi:non-specific serine/threonine protein kinase